MNSIAPTTGHPAPPPVSFLFEADGGARATVPPLADASAGGGRFLPEGNEPSAYRAVLACSGGGDAARDTNSG